MTEKPRCVTCWLCSKMLRSRSIFTELMIDGHLRILHKACARDMEFQRGLGTDFIKRQTTEYFSAEWRPSK